MNEQAIIKELYRFYANYDYKLSNSFIYLWESDFFCISSSGYAVEVEVKISKSDFKADFKKTLKHHILKNGNRTHVVIPGHETYYEGTKYTGVLSSQISIIPARRPNRFYYCCPENLIQVEDIPDYAGLLYYITESTENYEHNFIKEVKPSKFIHKDKLDLCRVLLNKFYYLSLEQSRDIYKLKYRLHQLEKFFDYKSNLYDEENIASKNKEHQTFFMPELF